MCDVMPSIAETGREADLRDSVCSDIDEEHDYDIGGGHGDDGLLLDEKEELVESLREAQDNLASTQASLQRLEHERDSLYARLFTSQPVVRTTCHLLSYCFSYSHTDRNIFSCVQIVTPTRDGLSDICMRYGCETQLFCAEQRIVS